MKTDNTVGQRSRRVWLSAVECDIAELAALVERTASAAD